MSNHTHTRIVLSATSCTILICIGFLIACVWVQQLSGIRLQQLHISGLILLFILFLCIVSLKQQKSHWFFLVLLLLAVCLGFIRAWSQANYRLNSSLPVLVSGIQANVTGCISSIPIKKNNVIRFLYDVRDKKVIGHRLNKLRVSIYQNKKSFELTDFKAGSCWELPLKIKTNRGLRNQNSFDYERWLFQQGIGATAYLKGEPKRLSRDEFLLLKMRSAIAEHISESISAETNERISIGLILGLSLGLRDYLSKDDWQVLQKTGTSHLLAISGLHIGIAALFGYCIGKLLWLLLSIFMQIKYNPKQVGLVISMSFALFYASLAGFSVPTQRACIMLFCSYGALFLHLRFDAICVLSIALILVLLIDPMAVLSIGTWLSFVAVGVLVYFLQRDRKHLESLARFEKKDSRFIGNFKKPIKIQCLLIAFLSIPVALGFGLVSLTAPLANLVLIPIFTFSVVPMLLIAIILLPVFSILSTKLLLLQALWLENIWQVLSNVSKLNYSVIEFSPTPGLALILLCLLLPYIFARKLLPRILTCIGLLPLIFDVRSSEFSAKLEMHVFDVGQGLAILVRTKEHSLLYDTGPAYRNGGSAVERVIEPYLHRLDLSELSALVISHTDNDHAGGMLDMVNAISVAKVFAPKNDSVNNSIPCVSGEKWQWDAVQFEFLYPFEHSNYSNNNNLSCVLKISFDSPAAQKAILLTGDIEKEAEYSLLSRHLDLNADIVIAAHHGSRTSSIKPFTKAVKPNYVIYSTSFGNQWGFPREEAIANWRHSNVDVLELNTAIDGNIVFQLDAQGVWKSLTWKQSSCRYWHQDCE